MKKQNKKVNYKIISIILATIAVLVIILVATIKIKNKENKELKLDEFEEITIYGYLEDNVLDVTTIYVKSGKIQVDELQLFQSKLKQALDTYFMQHSENSVSTSTILGLVESKYIPADVDFHGIVVSDYEFNPENDTFEKNEGAYKSMKPIEQESNNMDYSNKKTNVQKVEKNSDGKYIVKFNIVDTNMPEDLNVEETGEAILKIEKSKITIEKCTLYN